MLIQVKKLYKFLFTHKEQNQIMKIISDITRNKNDYKTHELWRFDQTLGGIGGYCINPDPCKQVLFQGKNTRNIYRCLQYTRSYIDINSIYFSTRGVIKECGFCLEECLKLLLIKGLISNVKYNNKTYGQLVNVIENKKLLNDELQNGLKLFIPIYNISKHSILTKLEDNMIVRTFSVEDAIISYFACRKIEKQIMLIVDHDYACYRYEIIYTSKENSNNSPNEHIFKKWTEDEMMTNENSLKKIIKIN